jgi:phosphoenolpyruvate---glycerone phosphotransferase subunit DhaL
MESVMGDLPAPAGLTVADLRAILGTVALDLQEHLEELRELDAVLGDGDLGITMQLASGAIADAAGGVEGAKIGAAAGGHVEDVGMTLATLGMSINKVSPSTFGTLLASAFMGAGASVRGKSRVGLEDLMAMGAGAVEGIKKRGKADVGDKTMLDALVPAVEAFRSEIDTGAGAARAFDAAATAGEKGMEATTGMIAKFGRASWRREDSVGVCDAGATAMCYLIRSFARGAAGYFPASPD